MSESKEKKPPVTITGVHKSETPAAIFLDLAIDNGTPGYVEGTWIPKSLISDEHRCKEGVIKKVTVTIPAWLAEKNKLIADGVAETVGVHTPELPPNAQKAIKPSLEAPKFELGEKPTRGREHRMGINEALDILDIADYYPRIYGSNSHGELTHLEDYVIIAEAIGQDAEWFRPWFRSTVALAEARWDRPESVFQHIARLLKEYARVNKETS